MDKQQLTPQRFIFTYIIPMFTVALVLVLLSYAGQLRMDTMEQKIVVLEGQLAQKQEELDVFAQRYSELTETLENLETEHSRNLEEVSDKDEQIAVLQEQVEAFAVQLESLKGQLDTMSEELAKTKEELRLAREEQE